MFLCDNCHNAAAHFGEHRSVGACENCHHTAACIDCHYHTCKPPMKHIAPLRAGRKQRLRRRPA